MIEPCSKCSAKYNWLRTRATPTWILSALPGYLSNPWLRQTWSLYAAYLMDVEIQEYVIVPEQGMRGPLYYTVECGVRVLLFVFGCAFSLSCALDRVTGNHRRISS